MAMTQKERQEKWQSLDGKLGGLRTKMGAAGLFFLTFLGALSWMAYTNIKEIISSVETLAKPSHGMEVINAMVADISDLQSHLSQYTLSQNEQSLEKYHQKIDDVKRGINDLKTDSSNETYKHKLDTLETIFDEYIAALDEYSQVRTLLFSVPETRTMGLIDSSENSIKTSDDFLQKSKIKTVTEVIEKKTLVEPEKKKLFKKNKKKDVVPDTLNQTVVTQITTEVDSGYLNKVDTLLSQMKSSLTYAQKRRSGIEKKLSRRESELISLRLTLMSRMRVLLNYAKEEEILQNQATIGIAKQTAQVSSERLVALGFVGMLLMLVLFFVLFTDISKSLFYRKKLKEAKEEAERLAKAKEDFLANMSHEIRTPLNSIIGFTEQLRDSSIPDQEKEKAKAVLRSSNHLLVLINDILDFTKLEAGSLRLEYIGFCYKNVIDETLEMLEYKAKGRGIELFFSNNASAETIVKGDPVRVKQVLLNLVANAIKFTRKGHVTIHTNHREENGKIWVTCSVADTGKGIKKSEINNIFNKFEQEDSSISRLHGGSGLGLSICKKLVELHGGSIGVESEEGVGSTFTFDIPFEPSQENNYTSSVSIGEYIPGLLSGKRILVIDDDILIEKILTPIFAENGMISSFRQNTEKALRQIKEEVFDVIFVDLHMPGINGLDMLCQIKNNPESKNQKAYTVLSTANVMKNMEIVANQATPDYILYKPFKKADVLKALYQSVVYEIDGEMPDDYTLKNFKEFAANDSALLRSFISLFVSESRSGLAKLDDLLAEKNYKEIGEIAHMFKNTYGQLEANPELEIIGRLEGLVKENNNSDEELYELIASLKEKSELLFTQIQEEIDEISSS